MTIFRQTGGLMLGTRDSAVVSGARRSAELHGLPHEVINADEVRRRFPAFRPRDEDIGVVEPRAGMLHPELAISTCIDLAVAHGAEVLSNEVLLSWRAVGSGVEVVTDHGRYQAAKLVLTVGAWAVEVFPRAGPAVRGAAQPALLVRAGRECGGVRPRPGSRSSSTS